MDYELSLARAEKLADTFAMLSSPYRLQILGLLAKQGETNVGGILRAMPELKPTTLSTHLIRLKQAGLIDCRRKHRYRYYFIRDTAILRLIESTDDLYSCASSEVTR